MSYASLVELTGSVSLRERIAACAAMEGYTTDPMAWVFTRMWEICSDQVWIVAWENALKQADNTKFNPDIGARDDVITDAMILAVVQPMLAPA